MLPSPQPYTSSPYILRSLSPHHHHPIPTTTKVRPIFPTICVPQCLCSPVPIFPISRLSAPVPTFTKSALSSLGPSDISPPHAFISLIHPQMCFLPIFPKNLIPAKMFTVPKLTRSVSRSLCFPDIFTSSCNPGLYIPRSLRSPEVLPSPQFPQDVSYG